MPPFDRISQGVSSSPFVLWRKYLIFQILNISNRFYTSNIERISQGVSSSPFVLWRKYSIFYVFNIIILKSILNIKSRQDWSSQFVQWRKRHCHRPNYEEETYPVMLPCHRLLFLMLEENASSLLTLSLLSGNGKKRPFQWSFSFGSFRIYIFGKSH